MRSKRDRSCHSQCHRVINCYDEYPCYVLHLVHWSLIQSDLICPFTSLSDSDSGNVHVDLSALTKNLPPQQIGDIIDQSLSEWRKLKPAVSMVWVKLPRDKFNLFDIFIEKGFEVNNGNRDYIKLAMWLQNGNSLIPNYAYSFVGVQFIVLNHNGEMLVGKNDNMTTGSYVWFGEHRKDVTVDAAKVCFLLFLVF